MRISDWSSDVCSSDLPFLIEPLLKAFSEQTGIKTNVVFAKDGVVERMKAEGANSPADVILTVDIGRLNDAVDAGVVQSVDSATLNANSSEERRVGKECVSTCRSRGSPEH